MEGFHISPPRNVGLSGMQGTNEKEVMLPFDLDVPGSIYY